jgi:hypothetical protein
MPFPASQAPVALPPWRRGGGPGAAARRHRVGRPPGRRPAGRVWPSGGRPARSRRLNQLLHTYTTPQKPLHHHSTNDLRLPGAARAPPSRRKAAQAGRDPDQRRPMSALFDFQSFLTVVLLFICTCTYYKLIYPGGLVQTQGCGPERAGGGRGRRGAARRAARRGAAPRGARCAPRRLAPAARAVRRPRSRLSARAPPPPRPAGSRGCSGRRRG